MKAVIPAAFSLVRNASPVPLYVRSSASEVVGKSDDAVCPETNALPSEWTEIAALEIEAVISPPPPPRPVEYDRPLPEGFSFVTKASAPLREGAAGETRLNSMVGGEDPLPDSPASARLDRRQAGQYVSIIRPRTRA